MKSKRFFFLVGAIVLALNASHTMHLNCTITFTGAGTANETVTQDTMTILRIG